MSDELDTLRQSINTRKVRVIAALADAGLGTDLVTAAAAFEIGTEVLVMKGIGRSALQSRLHALIVEGRQLRSLLEKAAADRPVMAPEPPLPQ